MKIYFRFTSTSIVLLVMLSYISQVGAQTWGQFRGDSGLGISESQALPVKWSDDSVAWSADLPGQGNSSPAVNSTGVYITSQTRDMGLHVLAFSKINGEPLWSKKVGKGQLAAKGPANLYAHRHNAATPSPIVDDSNVWAFFGTGLLVCLDAKSGELKWEVDMVQEYGAYDITFGMGSTPRLIGDKLIVSCMTKGASYVVALHVKNGELVWKHDRRFPAKDDGPDALNAAGFTVSWRPEQTARKDTSKGPKPLECDEVVLVTVTSTTPGTTHWVGAYSPPNAAVNETAPVKYAILHRVDGSNYAKTGVATVSSFYSRMGN